MQLKKWWVITVLSLIAFFFTGGLFYARNYAVQYEAELAEKYQSCNLEGWKQ